MTKDDSDDQQTMSLQARLVRAVSSTYFDFVDAGNADVLAMRRRLDRFARLVPTAMGVSIEKTQIGGLAAEWLVPSDARSGRVILYLHGGAYVLGSCDSHRHLVSHIAKSSGVKALLPEYRLAPEHPFPAAVEDAAAAYSALLDDGVSASDIVVMGDSAGGGLSVAMLLFLKEKDLPMPALACLLSPWLDLSVSGTSMTSRADDDPWFSPEDLPHVTSYYCGESELQNPLVSPVFGDASGLPPVYIQVGDHEILLSDSERLVENIRAANGDVEIEVWPDMWHVFQAFLLIIPESRSAVDKLATRIRRHFD